MSLTIVKQDSIWKPIKEEKELARKASELLGPIYNEMITHHEDSQAFFKKVSEAHILIPPKVIVWMLQVLKEVASGNAVTLIPIHAEMTTQQAADYLNVSRPFLIGLLNQGKIKFRKVGRHRRVQFGDIVEFQRISQELAETNLANMTSRTQELEGDDFDLQDLKEIE